MTIRARNTDFWEPWADGSVEKEATLVGGSATITDASINLTDHFLAMHVSSPSSAGALYTSAVTDATSVKIVSTNSSDVSKIRVMRFRVPAEQVV